MLELLGIAYLAYSTYRIAKKISRIRAILWFISTVLFYFIFVYGLTFTAAFILASLQISDGTIISVLISLVFIGLAILIIHSIQDSLEERIRIREVKQREKLSESDKRTKLKPFIGQSVSINYANSSSEITKENSSLDNGSSVVISLNGNNSYLQNNIKVQDGIFSFTHEDSRMIYQVSGMFKPSSIEVKVITTSKLDGTIHETLDEAFQEI